MHLAVCPPRGPGHDSSVGERMILTVCPLRGPGSTPRCGGVSRDFSLADRTLPTRPEPAWQKWLNLPSVSPHNLWAVRRKAEVQLWTDNGWKRRTLKTLYFRFLSSAHLLTLCVLSHFSLWDSVFIPFIYSSPWQSAQVMRLHSRSLLRLTPLSSHTAILESLIWWVNLISAQTEVTIAAFL